jgi:hypothetical protein
MVNYTMKTDDIINEILTEWAFRVPNGMPTMDNVEHKSILKEVIIDLGYSEILNEKKDEEMTIHKGQNPTI